MMVNGRKYPSAGTLLSSLLVSIKDKAKLELVGKPNPFCLQLIKEQHSIND
jgi:hypothetical protein